MSIANSDQTDLLPPVELTITQIVDWHRNLNNEVCEIHEELIKLIKLAVVPEFQPLLNILKSVKDTESIGDGISSVFPLERWTEFEDLNNFDQNFVSKFNNDMENVIKQNEYMSGQEQTWIDMYSVLLKRMKFFFTENVKVSHHFVIGLNENIHDVTYGYDHLDCLKMIRQIQPFKVEIEKGIAELNEIVKQALCNFKNACDSTMTKSTKIAVFHKSLDELKSKKVFVMATINEFNKKIAALYTKHDELDKKRSDVVRIFQNCLNSV